MSAPPHESQRRVVYSGHVQGVGFRYTTARIADGFAVVGFVRNLADGRVELVAEGTKQELDRFLLAIDDRLGHHIRSATTDAGVASGNYRSFEIRY